MPTEAEEDWIRAVNRAPTAMPSTMDTGMPAKAPRSAVPPWAIPVKVEKSTMTKTSSKEAPARIILGLCFLAMSRTWS